MKTGLIWDERLMWHDSGNHFGPRSQWIEPAPHPENVDTKRRIKNLLDVSGLTAQLSVIPPRSASKADLLRVHSADYIARVEQISLSGGGNIARQATTHMAEGGFNIASLAAGATLTAVDAVMQGQVRNAYALLRPPGHHAEADDGKGFCIFNNAAMAAAYALDELGLSRVTIIDIDAHHGNGAQTIFWSDPRVLSISLHQDRGFPLSVGSVDEQGEGEGLGYTLNVPLPPGSSEAAYIAAMQRVVLPALDAFEPELIIIPCGFDAGFMDPTARMMLSSESFRALTNLLMTSAEQHCQGRLVFSHEGGYHFQTVPFHALAVMEALSGIRTEVNDPFLPANEVARTAALQAHQDAAIQAAETAMQSAPIRRRST